jgi:hypothetical protein
MKTLPRKVWLALAAVVLISGSAGQANAQWGHRRAAAFAPVVGRPLVVASPVWGPVASAPIVAAYAPVAVAPVTNYYAPANTTYYAPATTTYYAPPATSYYAPATTTFYAPAAGYVTPTTTYYAPAAPVILRRPGLIVP